MLEERIIQMINADLDGELGQAEKEELDAILESSAEARSMRVELLKLTNLLDSVPEVTPPSGLSEQILDKLASSPRKSTFSLAGLFPSFQPATAGLAFAAGLLLTVGYYELAPRHGSSVDTAGMVGAMVAGQQDRQAVQRDRLTIDQAGVSGTVSLQQSGGFLVLSFDLDSEQTTEIEVSLAEAGLSFGGIAHAPQQGETSDESFQVSGGGLRVVNQGRKAFTVFLQDDAMGDGSGREITVGVSTGGVQVFSGVLRG